MDDGSDDERESGEEGAEDPNSGPHAGFLSSTWSFIITFFMSLIPEGLPNAAHWTTSTTSHQSFTETHLLRGGSMSYLLRETVCLLQCSVIVFQYYRLYLRPKHKRLIQPEMRKTLVLECLHRDKHFKLSNEKNISSIFQGLLVMRKSVCECLYYFCSLWYRDSRRAHEEHLVECYVCSTIWISLFRLRNCDCLVLFES